MTHHAAQPARRQETSDPRVEHALHYAVAIGAVLVMLLPAARGFSDTFGWLPMWLLAMPLIAWWALHRFRLPLSRSHRVANNVSARRRRPGGQARRRAMPPARRSVAVRAA